jgi:beta-glucanase (GH16 family)
MRFRARFFLLSCLAAAGPSIAVVAEAPRSDAGAQVTVDRPRTELAARPAPDACGWRLRKEDGTLWECTFDDEFDGDALDRDKWTAGQTAVSGITNGTGGCYRDRPWTVSVGNGALRLHAERLTQQVLCRSPLGDFPTDLVSATVSTRGKFSQTYGRFAFRAKLPSLRVAGAHSTMWLYPDKHTYGAWPLSGEIDVAEWYSVLSDRIFPSLHYVDGLKNVVTGMDATIDPGRFHTYEVEWTATSMRFSYDGILTYETNWSPLAPLVGSQPFDKPFNVVLTQAWGGLWNAISDDTPRKVSMYVDWVRVWK